MPMSFPPLQLRVEVYHRLIEACDELPVKPGRFLMSSNWTYAGALSLRLIGSSPPCVRTSVPSC